MDCKLTIFTPIYNRADCIHKCYESLLKQDNKKFIWIIVDDGSTDQLYETVMPWIQNDNGFLIEYYQKENGGMYTAYNVALSHVKTDYWMCIDSDDWLTDTAVDLIYQAIHRREKERLDVCGFVGLDALPDGSICGGYLPSVEQIGLMDIKLRYRHRGDIKVIYRTESSAPFLPMPEIQGEKDFNPYYVMLQMDRVAPLLVINRVLCIVDYQNGGMSSRVFQSYAESPVSFGMLRLQYLQMPNLPWWFRIKQSMHYVSSWLFAKEQGKTLTSPTFDFCMFMSIIPGIVFHTCIRIYNYTKKIFRN